MTAAVCALVLLLAGCGGDDDTDDTNGATPAAADLTVVVYPRGPDGPMRKRHIRCERLGSKGCRNLAGLSAEQLKPVPEGTACTQIYGGPATARVRGRLRGDVVDARFDRTDGCQIERWDRNRVLLGD